MVWDISIRRSVKGTMTPEFATGESPEEWQITTTRGEAVDIVLGENQALFLHNGEDVVVTIRWGQLALTRQDGVDLSKESLERYAETVNFTVLGGAGKVELPDEDRNFIVPTPEIG